MKTKMAIEIKGWELEKNDEDRYMINTPDTNMFIHCDKLTLKKHDASTWLNLHNRYNGFYSIIGRIWITKQEDTDKLNKLIEA